MRIAIADSISATTARMEKLRGALEDKKARKLEYAALISQHSDGKVYPCKSYSSLIH